MQQEEEKSNVPDTHSGRHVTFKDTLVESFGPEHEGGGGGGGEDDPKPVRRRKSEVLPFKPLEFLKKEDIIRAKKSVEEKRQEHILLVTRLKAQKAKKSFEEMDIPSLVPNRNMEDELEEAADAKRRSVRLTRTQSFTLKELGKKRADDDPELLIEEFQNTVSVNPRYVLLSRGRRSSTAIKKVTQEKEEEEENDDYDLL